jgi:autotransporter adhesin
VITWVPFYYTVYEVPKKLLQGRDATAMDLIQAALDPVMLIADVATGGGAEVTRRALIAAGKETGERLGEKAIVVTLEKSAADLASRKIGAEAAEQVATRGGVAMADLTMTALLSETQASLRGPESPDYAGVAGPRSETLHEG